MLNTKVLMDGTEMPSVPPVVNKTVVSERVAAFTQREHPSAEHEDSTTVAVVACSRLPLRIAALFQMVIHLCPVLVLAPNSVLL